MILGVVLSVLGFFGHEPPNPNSRWPHRQYVHVVALVFGSELLVGLFVLWVTRTQGELTMQRIVVPVMVLLGGFVAYVVLSSSRRRKRERRQRPTDR